MSIAASWIQLTEYNNNFFYYRRIPLYQNISWSNDQGVKLKDLSCYETSVCPFGGPIALFKKPTGTLLLDNNNNNSNGNGSNGSGSNGSGGGSGSLDSSQIIYIYNAACKFQRKIDMTKEEPLIGIGWTDDMKLMCLTKKRLSLFNVFNGERYTGPWQNDDVDKKKESPHLESKLKKNQKDSNNSSTATTTSSTFISIPLQSEEEIKSHTFYGEGCVIFTSKRRLLVAYDLSETKPFHEYIFPKSAISTNAELSHSVMAVVTNFDLTVRKTKVSHHDMKKSNSMNDKLMNGEEKEDDDDDYDDDDDDDDKPITTNRSASTIGGGRPNKPTLNLSPSLSNNEKASSGGGFFSNLLGRRNKRTIVNGNSLSVSGGGGGGGSGSEKSFKVGKGPLILFSLPDRMSIVACYSNLYKDLKLNERLKGDIPERDTSGFTKISISPDYKTISAFHQASGHLFVFDLALTSNYLKFFTGITEEHRLDSLTYCGGESMMLYWSPENIGGGDQSLVLLVNCFGHYESFTFDGPIVVSQEIDSCRYYTSHSVEMVERIPESIVEVFRIGSLSPAALLYDAYSDYVNERATCLKTIREIKNKEMGDQSVDALYDGVNKCIDAACREFNLHIQEQLLNAAIYGKNFMRSTIEEAKAFQLKCKYIRLMNELRSRSEIPLTYEQILSLSPQVLVQRLSEMREYLLAYKICDYLNLAKAKVLEHWAKAMIRSKIDDRNEASQLKLKDVIIKNLAKFSTSVSFSNIAMEAYKVQKPKLAKALLEVDSNANSQIKLYLSMHETLSALDKSQKSNDTDLLFTVLLYLMKFFDPYYMYEMIADKKMARKLFISYCTQLGKYKKLQNFYKYLKSEQNEETASRESGFTHIRHAYKNYDSVDEKKAEERFAYYIEKAESCFKERSGDKLDLEFALKERELYGLQLKLEDETDEEFVGAPLQDTLYRVMISEALREKKGERKKYVKVLKKNFSVSSKRYYYSKIKALVYLKEWKKLETFATSKKSPIGYIPFVEACLDAERSDEALKYIPKIESLETKVEYWITLLKFKEAIEAAFEARDVELLEYIQRKTKNSKTKDTIEQCLKQLK